LGRGVRRMDEGKPDRAEVGAGTDPQVVTFDVRIVQAEHFESDAVLLEASLAVLQVDPSLPLQLSDEVGGSAPLRGPTPALAPEVREVVERSGGEVVVRSQDEV